MSEWCRLQDFLGLPDLPTSYTGLRKKADREGWKCRAREGRGGGWEYSIDSLPAPARAALIVRDATRETLENPPLLQGFGGVDKERAWANLQILQAFDQFCEQYGEGQLQLALELQFCELYNQRELISIAPKVFDLFPTISRSKLCRDRKAFQTEGVRALGKASRRSGEIDSYPEVGEALEVCVAAGRGRWNPKQILKALQTTFEKLPFYPSLSQIRRWLARFATECRHKLIQYRSEAESRNKLLPAFGKASAGITEPNQLWELDDTKQDLILEYQEDGEWKEKRFALVGAIDVFTRRRKFQIYPTANSEAVLLLLRRCILDWGKPGAVKTDNGKNYISERVELFLRALDIGVNRCDPYNPQQKPHIERLFRTLQHGEFEMLPGYCGHNVAERQSIREADNALRLRMEPEAFQEWLDRWCEKAHLEGSKGLEGRSPIEVLATAIRSGWKAREVADERALDFLILPVKSRKVQKGGIQINNRWYIAGELGRMVGKEVHCRWHPDDPNRIYVYDSEELDRMLCVALAAEPLSEEQQARLAAAAKTEYRLAKEEVSAKRKQAKQLKRMVESDPAQLVKVSKAGNVEIRSPRVPVTRAIDPFFPPAPPAEPGREPAPRNRESGKVLPPPETKTPQQLFQEQSGRYRSLLEYRVLEGGDLNEEEEDFVAFWEEIYPAAAKAQKEAVSRKKTYALTGFYD